jgi:hypothetical protein
MVEAKFTFESLKAPSVVTDSAACLVDGRSEMFVPDPNSEWSSDLRSSSAAEAELCVQPLPA